jgi:hypothetical protein
MWYALKEQYERHTVCLNNRRTKSMRAVCIDDESAGPQWDLDDMIRRFVNALNAWLEERPKKRKNLHLVHFDPMPEVKAFGKANEQGLVFNLKIAAGARFPLVVVPSEQTRLDFIASCRLANSFVPAITPILEEKTWQLLQRMKRLVHRMVRAFKHEVRHRRGGHPGRFSQEHCHRAAMRAILV